jgi:hypothetical protein
MYRKVVAVAQFDWDCGLAELVLPKLCFIVVLKIDLNSNVVIRKMHARLMMLLNGHVKLADLNSEQCYADEVLMSPDKLAAIAKAVLGMAPYLDEARQEGSPSSAETRYTRVVAILTLITAHEQIKGC